MAYGQSGASNGARPPPISTAAALPVSAERNKPIVRTEHHDQGAVRADWVAETCFSIEPQAGNDCSSSEWSDNDLMEEDECRNIGSRRPHRGPKSEDAEGESELCSVSRSCTDVHR